MYKEFGGMPKDLNKANDYDPKVLDMADSAQYWMPGNQSSRCLCMWLSYSCMRLPVSGCNQYSLMNRLLRLVHGDIGF